MAKGIDGNAGTEIKITVAIGRDGPGTLAPFKGNIGPGLGRKKS